MQNAGKKKCEHWNRRKRLFLTNCNARNAYVGAAHSDKRHWVTTLQENNKKPTDWWDRAKRRTIQLENLQTVYMSSVVIWQKPWPNQSTLQAGRGSVLSCALLRSILLHFAADRKQQWHDRPYPGSWVKNSWSGKVAGADAQRLPSASIVDKGCKIGRSSVKLFQRN